MQYYTYKPIYIKKLFNKIISKLIFQISYEYLMIFEDRNEFSKNNPFIGSCEIGGWWLYERNTEAIRNWENSEWEFKNNFKYNVLITVLQVTSLQNCKRHTFKTLSEYAIFEGNL